MLPVPGTISTAPSLTSHFGSVPPRPTHASRFEPLKSTTASDGTDAVEKEIDGGIGRCISFGNHLSFGDCADALYGPAKNVKIIRADILQPIISSSDLSRYLESGLKLIIRSGDGPSTVAAPPV
jgi:hypothetical protein